MGGDAVAAKGKHRDSKAEGTPTYAVEVEYVPTKNSDGTLPRTCDLLPDGCQAPGIPSEAERHERMIKILSEGVYAYLRRKGLLAVRGDQTVGKMPRDRAVVPENGHAGVNCRGGKILDE